MIGSLIPPSSSLTTLSRLASGAGALHSFRMDDASLVLELKELFLRRPPLTLAVAESLTGGHLQSLVTAVSGASEFFAGGITAYSLEQKVRHLRVDRTHAKRVQCVSQRVAVEMAAGVCVMFGTSIGVATTGYAEPSRARKIKTPQAWWAICHGAPRGPAEVVSGFVETPGATRTEAQHRIADAVLRELVKYVRDLREIGS